MAPRKGRGLFTVLEPSSAYLQCQHYIVEQLGGVCRCGVERRPDHMVFVPYRGKDLPDLRRLMLSRWTRAEAYKIYRQYRLCCERCRAWGERPVVIGTEVVGDEPYDLEHMP